MLGDRASWIVIPCPLRVSKGALELDSAACALFCSEGFPENVFDANSDTFSPDLTSQAVTFASAPSLLLVSVMFLISNLFPILTITDLSLFSVNSPLLSSSRTLSFARIMRSWRDRVIFRGAIFGLISPSRVASCSVFSSLMRETPVCRARFFATSMSDEDGFGGFTRGNVRVPVASSKPKDERR